MRRLSPALKGRPLVELNAATPVPAARPFAAASPRPVVKPPPTGLGDPGRPVQVFGRRSCPWSGRVLALLESNRMEHSYLDLDADGGHFNRRSIGRAREA